jgi:hypothetical protein
MAVSPAIAAPKHRVIAGTVIPISESPSYTRADEEKTSRPDADGLGCVRGIRAAFLLEALAALSVYGIWHLWHLAH